MKIEMGDIYREQIPRYTLAKKIVSKKILDITYGKFMDYFKSELFIDNGATEIWSLDLLDDEQYLTLRQLNDEKKIHLQIKNKNDLKTRKFDLILGFNILSIINEPDKLLSNISELLSNEGTVIISVISKNLSKNSSNNNFQDLNFFTKNELDKNLKKYFNKINYFFQESVNNIKKDDDMIKIETQNKKIKSILRMKLREFFLKSENRRMFYVKYIQPKYRKIHKRRNKIKPNLTKYDIVPFSEKQNELFIIAVCKK